MYQMAVKYVYQVIIKYTNIIHSKSLQNIPQLVFLVCKYTIWQPLVQRRHAFSQTEDRKTRQTLMKIGSNGFGIFSFTLDIFGHFRTISDNFGHFRTLSDIFGYFRTHFQTFSDTSICMHTTLRNKRRSGIVVIESTSRTKIPGSNQVRI
jgi:hypothetical protein